jgi:hypothetical protein
MLLILTNSLDGTSDELVRRIGSQNVFRFNLDLWRDYGIEIAPGTFSLVDPSERSVESRQVAACYVRKPTFDDPLDVPAAGCVEAWLRSQMSYVNQELYNLCHSQGKARLVEKGAQQRFGKFRQMEVAVRYFEVPKWRFTKGSESPSFFQPAVAKSLTADFVEDFRFFYTTRVESRCLDPGFPWFLQEEIKGECDLTVVYVAGRSFAFTLARDFEGVDWRRHINKTDLPWERCSLSSDDQDRIRAFMVEANLDFGRLDFVVRDGQKYFLEVNPNGQWAWLDPDGSEGIFDAVVAVLTEGWAKPVEV